MTLYIILRNLQKIKRCSICRAQYPISVILESYSVIHVESEYIWVSGYKYLILIIWFQAGFVVYGMLCYYKVLQS